MAVVSGIILNRLKVPAIIGYIVTGILATYIFGFNLEDSGDLREAADLGIVFLMFMIGLDFSFKKITQMKQEVLLFGGLQIGLSIAAFFSICHFLFYFDFNTSIVIASAISLSSTAIVLKHINETNQARTSYGAASVGILVFQDIAVIPILLMIKLLSNTSLSATEMFLNTGLSAIAVLLLLILPGRLLARMALGFSARMKTDEIFVGSVFLIVLGSAYLSKYFGFSLSLGAFLAGMIISSSPYRYQVASVLVYFRDLLLGVFFLTIGMQVDIVFAVKYFLIVLVFSVLILILKTLVMFLFLALFRGVKVGMRIALSLSQIGEFSFAIFLLASQYKILNLKLDGGVLSWILGEEFLTTFTSDEVYQFLTLMVIFSMVATPFILERLDSYVDSVLGLLRLNEQPHREEGLGLQEERDCEIVVCGYGVLGKKVLNFLKDYDVNILVIDSNIEHVRESLKDGYHTIYGNITDKMIFKEIQIQNAAAVVLCVESSNTVLQAAIHIMSLAHHVRIITQTREDALEENLKGLGLYGVINNDQEVALILSNLALKAVEEYKSTEEAES